MRVIQTAGGLGERYGGPSRSITGLSSWLGRAGVDVSLVAGVDPRVDGELVQADPRFVNTVHVKALTVGPLRIYPRFRQEVVRLIESAYSPALVHDHGLWGHFNLCASRAALDTKVPYVLSPRGMIEPWAINYRAWKKRPAMALYQRRILENTALLVATAESEYNSARRLGLRMPIAIVPNGIEPCESVWPASTIRPPAIGQARTALFLSRIHPKKGLDNLLDAWAQLSPTGWHLKIAGPDEGGHLKEVLKTIARRGLSSTVEYVGPASGEAKSRLYREAALFVLPTHSENFGLVVAEALAHELPVITTKGAPWRDLETYHCGWWVDIGVAPLIDALRQAFALSDEQRRAMGIRGREYVRCYDWGEIAARMIEAYSWILGRGDRPDCVQLD